MLITNDTSHNKHNDVRFVVIYSEFVTQAISSTTNIRLYSEWCACRGKGWDSKCYYFVICKFVNAGKWTGRKRNVHVNVRACISVCVCA